MDKVVEATSVDGTVMAIPDNEVKEKKAIAKEELKEEIVAMAVMKRADKRRYGNLQISLKFLYLLGGNIYPSFKYLQDGMDTKQNASTNPTNKSSLIHMNRREKSAV